ncbi:hypothetical protein HDU92_006086 [Lobulomyces angularis]|nr:hypothetical protein HDU92_006086 [Lobulomyces angularis]
MKTVSMNMVSLVEYNLIAIFKMRQLDEYDEITDCIGKMQNYQVSGNAQKCRTCIGADVRLPVELLTPVIARGYFVNVVEEEIPVPQGFLVQDATNNVPVNPFGNSYFLALSNNYESSLNCDSIINVVNQRQWSTNAKSEITI